MKKIRHIEVAYICEWSENKMGMFIYFILCFSAKKNLFRTSCLVQIMVHYFSHPYKIIDQLNLSHIGHI